MAVSRIIIRRALSQKRSAATVVARYCGIATETIQFPVIILLVIGVILVPGCKISQIVFDDKARRVPITVLYVVLPTTVLCSVQFCMINIIVFATGTARSIIVLLI